MSMDEMDHSKCRAYLLALPDVAPGPQLWQRIEQAQARRRRPDVRWWAAAAALALAVLAAWSLPGVDRWAGPPLAGVTPSGTLVPALHQLDADLNLAYSRGAGDAEIAALWEARARLLASGGDAGSVVLAKL
jgi:hypothetical protein